MSLQPGATSVTAGTELVERALASPVARWAWSLPPRSRPRPRVLTGCSVTCSRTCSTPWWPCARQPRAACRCPWIGETTCAGGPPDELAVVASLRHHGCSLLGVWSRLDHDRPVAVGGGALPASTVARAGALEIAVHGWDVARACGSPWSLPDQLANDLLHHAAALVSPQDRGVRFAAPFPLPPGRPASDRLVAFTGRPPDWGP